MNDIIELFGIDDDLGQGNGTLRAHVATGLISREQVELAGSEIAYEATYEAPNTSPGTARSVTVRITEEAYNELGTLGVP